MSAPTPTRWARCWTTRGCKPAAHDVAPAGRRRHGRATATPSSSTGRARSQLTVDGVSRQVYVTALSVDEALGQLGYRADGLVLSASRSERLPLQGMDLTITTPKEIVLVADGQQRVVTTTAATAGDLLAEQGIALSQTDKTSLYLNQGLLNRMRLQVFRVQVNEVSETTAVPRTRSRRQDPERVRGRPHGHHARASTARRSPATSVTVVDGVETGREVIDSSRHRAAGHRAGHRGHQAEAGGAGAHRRRPELGGAGASASPAATRARSTRPATTGSTSSR